MSTKSATSDSNVTAQRFADREHGSCAQPRPILGSMLIGELFDPRLFIFCVLIGFAVCSTLGYLAGTTNQFGNIPRFGITLGPQASYFPTIRELIAFAHARAAGEKTIVIVGGSSILNGVGQSSEQIWTRALQKDLGPQYAVVNLGLRSCSSYEGAYFVAEALKKHGDRVLFVTGSSPSTHWHPLGKTTYAHLYWDAKYHGLLFNFPERERAISEREKALPDADWTRDGLDELKLSRFFNSNFHFLDLWTAAGFRYFYTIYNPITQRMPFAPLKKLSEIEGYENFPVPEKKMALDSIRESSAEMYTWSSSSEQWVKVPAAWDRLVTTVRTNVAPQLRPNTLVLLLHHNPTYVAQLPFLEKERDRVAYVDAMKALQGQGLRTLESCSDFDDRDFRDTKHLSSSGGLKLATQVSAELKLMSHTLGYVK